MASLPVPPAVAAIPPYASDAPRSASGPSSNPTALADVAGERSNLASFNGRPARFDGALVPGFEPCEGWSLMWTEEEDGDFFLTDLYFARSDTEDRLIHHCRFDFTPTQARFDWLVRNGFPSTRGSWTDAKIDAAIECEAAGRHLDSLPSDRRVAIEQEGAA
jgi:hypothetical protein